MSSSETPADKATAKEDKKLTASAEANKKPTAKAEEKETTPAKKPAQENKAASSTKPANKNFKWRTALLLLLIICVIAIPAATFYYGRYLQASVAQLETSNNTLQQSLNQLTNKLSSQQNLLTQQQAYVEQVNTLALGQQQQLEQLTKSQTDLVKSTQNIFDITHRNQRQWLLSEVSYLLSLANQRLLITGDVKTATVALKSANNRLHDLADPGLLPLRKQIADEVAALNLLTLPDINGIAFSLDNMASMIGQLHFKSNKQKSLESAQDSEMIEIQTVDKTSWFAPLWEKMKSLVTIKKHNREIVQSETPLEKTAIDQQLLNHLQTAKAALLKNNTDLFKHELTAARDLLSLYYDNNDQRVALLIQDITDFRVTELTPVLPDITKSWTLLQKLIAIHDANKDLTPTTEDKKGLSIQ